MIDIRGLDKRYGALHVLRGIDLHMHRGRVTAIVGPNSSGKTTLIKLLLGLACPDAGVIAVDGAQVNGDCAYRSSIGYMPQIARFPENLSAAELLAMLADVRGALPVRREELVERFSLAPHMHKPLRALSGGARQKVNAVAAFMFDAPLIVLDEPTAGLDPLSSSALKDLVLSERSRGKTFVLTSHNTADLEELADDVAFLLDGQVYFTGGVSDLKRTTLERTLERAIARVMRHEVAA